MYLSKIPRTLTGQSDTARYLIAPKRALRTLLQLLPPGNLVWPHTKLHGTEPYVHHLLQLLPPGNLVWPHTELHGTEPYVHHLLLVTAAVTT